MSDFEFRYDLDENKRFSAFAWITVPYIYFTISSELGTESTLFWNFRTEADRDAALEKMVAKKNESVTIWKADSCLVGMLTRETIGGYKSDMEIGVEAMDALKAALRKHYFKPALKPASERLIDNTAGDIKYISDRPFSVANTEALIANRNMIREVVLKIIEIEKGEA